MRRDSGNREKGGKKKEKGGIVIAIADSSGEKKTEYGFWISMRFIWYMLSAWVFELRGSALSVSIYTFKKKREKRWSRNGMELEWRLCRIISCNLIYLHSASSTYRID